jgi:hypothetical protein
MAHRPVPGSVGLLSASGNQQAPAKKLVIKPLKGMVCSSPPPVPLPPFPPAGEQSSALTDASYCHPPIVRASSLWRLAVKPELPANFEEVTWAKLRASVVAVHDKTPVSCSLEELYTVSQGGIMTRATA